MALIQCKECNRQFSDLATACPACGAPTAYSSAGDILSPHSNPQAVISPPPQQQPVNSVPFVQQIHIQFAEQKEQIRYVGSLLLIGVFFCPVIFYWFLLRQGHTNFARIAGLIWLMISVGWFVFLSYLLFRPDTVPEPAKQAETTPVRQPDEAAEQQFYPLSANPEQHAGSAATVLDDPLESIEADTGMPDTAADTLVDEDIGEEPDTTYADNFSECLLAQANTGNYSSAEGNRSAVKMLEACHTDFKAWHNQCVSQIRDEASCNFNASLLAHSALSVAGR